MVDDAGVLRMVAWASGGNDCLVGYGIVWVAVGADMGGYCLFDSKREIILELFWRFPWAHAADRLVLDNFIWVEDRLDRDLWVIGLDRFRLSFADGFFRNFNLDHEACAKCESAKIGDKASAEIGRIEERRGLAIDGEGCINEGVYKCIADLNFSG